MTRAEKKTARRRRRLDARGPARKHWNRRRAGTANSAPQLRHRGSLEEEYCDDLITPPRKRVLKAHNDPDMKTLFKGILSSRARDDLHLIAYNNSNRAAQRERDRANSK